MVSGQGCPFGAKLQRTETRPSRLDSAPYFAALVVSSWSTDAIVWVASGLRITSGPLMHVLLFEIIGCELSPEQLPQRYALPTRVA